MVLGVHCPVAAGFIEALRLARELSCAAMQMLPYRRHADPGEAELAGFRAARESSPVRCLLTHSRYVPSLGSGDKARRRHSIELLQRELRLSAALGAQSHVLHAGAWSEGSSREEALRLAGEAVVAAMERGGAVEVLFENVAGGGRRMGGALEDLAQLLEAARGAAKPCGVCIDTAHAWAAGWGISGAEGMLVFLERVHRVVGAGRVRAFHLNDTLSGLGSQRENHTSWGRGFLGREGLKALLARPEYADRPGIIESPWGSCSEASDLTYVRGLSAGPPSRQ